VQLKSNAQKAEHASIYVSVYVAVGVVYVHGQCDGSITPARRDLLCFARLRLRARQLGVCDGNFAGAGRGDAPSSKTIIHTVRS
jgi:hypothetical protein